MDAIQRAAVACLESMAINAIAIDDIAHAAGVSRRTFYRFFESRRSLFAQILQQRAVAIGAEIRRFTAGCESFSAAVIDGTMETLRLIAQDVVFSKLAEADSKLMLDIMVLDVDSAGNSLFFATWRDVFRRGRDEGVLRESITDVAAAQWLRGVHYLLSLRPDLNVDEKRALLIDFVLPSITLRETG